MRQKPLKPLYFKTDNKGRDKFFIIFLPKICSLILGARCELFDTGLCVEVFGHFSRCIVFQFEESHYD